MNKFCCDIITVMPRKHPTAKAVEKRFRMNVPSMANDRWRNADQYAAMERALDTLASPLIALAAVGVYKIIEFLLATT